jgi:hypothetical protein
MRARGGQNTRWESELAYTAFKRRNGDVSAGFIQPFRPWTDLWGGHYVDPAVPAINYRRELEMLWRLAEKNHTRHPTTCGKGISTTRLKRQKTARARVRKGGTGPLYIVDGTCPAQSKPRQEKQQEKRRQRRWTTAGCCPGRERRLAQRHTGYVLPVTNLLLSLPLSHAGAKHARSVLSGPTEATGCPCSADLQARAPQTGHTYKVRCSGQSMWTGHGLTGMRGRGRGRGRASPHRGPCT